MEGRSQLMKSFPKKDNFPNNFCCTNLLQHNYRYNREQLEAHDLLQHISLLGSDKQVPCFLIMFLYLQMQQPIANNSNYVLDLILLRHENLPFLCDTE
jgi:hypothetical protein